MRRSGLLLVGALVGAVIMVASGAFAVSGSSGTLVLQPGVAIGVSCPNALSNSGQTGSAETVNCAANATTSTTVAQTTTTSSTVPVTTTTTMPTTTTTTPQGGNPGCVFGSAPSATPAFCDSFTEGPTTNGSANTREGQLNGTIWGVSRFTGNQNFGGSSANDWASAQLSECGSTAVVNPPKDVQVCNGELFDTVNDGGTVTSLALYPKQPFDFAGRTGTIVFNVSDDSSGSHAAWPELWVADQPVPVPFTHEASLLNLPRNGFGVRFAAAVNPNTGNGAGCAGPPCTVTVDSAITVTNYTEDDSFNGGTLAVNDLGSVVESGPGQVNHFEVRVSQSQIDVYGTNAYTGTLNLAATPLVHIATIPNANLGFTRGLVYIEDAHYNGDKFNNQRVHTFGWSDVGFDGPTLTRDLTFDVPDNTVADNSTQAGPSVPATDLGYWVGPGAAISLTVPGITAQNIAAAAGGLLTFDYTDAASTPMTLTVLVNGHPVTVPASALTMGAPVPLADVVAGNNTVTFDGAGNGFNVMNVDLVMQGAGGPGGVVP